jgi:hypothetical protein
MKINRAFFSLLLLVSLFFGGFLVGGVIALWAQEGPIARVYNKMPLPPTEWMADLFEETAECLGLPPVGFEQISFFVGDVMVREADNQLLAGITIPLDDGTTEIYIALPYLNTAWLYRHEFIHVLNWELGEDDPEFLKCEVPL